MVARPEDEAGRNNLLRCCWALCIPIMGLLGCGALPCRRSPQDADPFAIVANAERDAKAGRHDDALREYLWALDHGADTKESFFGAQSSTVDAIGALGLVFPPAKLALKARAERLAGEVVRAAANRQEVAERTLRLFVRLCDNAGEPERILETYEAVKARVSSDSRLRQNLWMRIEERFVERRNYPAAVAELDVALKAVHFYLGVFKGAGVTDVASPIQPSLIEAVEYTVDHECGNHFEALLGAGHNAEADALAEELIQFRPTAHTFAVLIRHARRAGAVDVATRFRAKAYEVIPEADRAVIDTAFTEVTKDGGTGPAPPPEQQPAQGPR